MAAATNLPSFPRYLNSGDIRHTSTHMMVDASGDIHAQGTEKEMRAECDNEEDNNTEAFYRMGYAVVPVTARFIARPRGDRRQQGWFVGAECVYPC